VLYTLQECKWGAHLPYLGRSVGMYRIVNFTIRPEPDSTG